MCGRWHWLQAARGSTDVITFVRGEAMQHPPLPAAAPAAHGPRRAMRAVHLEATDGEGALPADLRHRVDGEEYLGALSVVCVCWRGAPGACVLECVGARYMARPHGAWCGAWHGARGMGRVVWCVAWGAWQGATHACAARVQGAGYGEGRGAWHRNGRERWLVSGATGRRARGGARLGIERGGPLPGRLARLVVVEVLPAVVALRRLPRGAGQLGVEVDRTGWPPQLTHEGAELAHVEQPVVVSVVPLQDGGGRLLAHIEPELTQRRAQLIVVELATAVSVEAGEGRAHLVRVAAVRVAAVRGAAVSVSRSKC